MDHLCVIWTNFGSRVKVPQIIKCLKCFCKIRCEYFSQGQGRRGNLLFVTEFFISIIGYSRNNEAGIPYNEKQWWAIWFYVSHLLDTIVPRLQSLSTRYPLESFSYPLDILCSLGSRIIQKSKCVVKEKKYFSFFYFAIEIIIIQIITFLDWIACTRKNYC